MHFFSYQDDAYIFFRYVENLVQHGELVFNLGERVEGFTSPLWVLLLSFTTWLGISPIYGAGLWGTMFLLVLLWHTYLDAEACGLKFPFTWLTPWALALSFHLMVWSVSGMETILFVLLLWLGLSQYRKDRVTNKVVSIQVGLWMALAALTRPEGGLPILLLWGHQLWLMYKKRAPFGSGKSLSRMAFPPIVAGLLLLAARWFYYGDILPNTFYAKVGDARRLYGLGLSYVWGFLKTSPLLWLALLLFIPQRNKSQQPKHPLPGAPNLGIGSVFVVSYSLYLLSIGGDHFQYHRFLVPILPLLYAWGSAGLYHAWRRWFDESSNTRRQHISKHGMVWGTLCLLLWLQYHPVMFQKYQGFQWLNGCAQLGQSLAQRLPKHTKIALPHIGAIGYYSRLPIIDILALTDRQLAQRPTAFPKTQVFRREDIGHAKFDIPFSLKRRPGVVVFSRGYGARPFTHPSEVPLSFEAERQLMRFLRNDPNYALRSLQVAPRAYWALFVRKDLRKYLLNTQ